MLQKLCTFMVLITLTVLVKANSSNEADNASEARTLELELLVESSVVNDNICNKHEKSVAFDVILFDNNSPIEHGKVRTVNKRQAPRDNRKDYRDRARPDQRSLLIVFDATGSMHDDLEQLRAGAQEIVAELSAREDNPIYNYVLVVYRDPSVEPPFDTRNPDDLLSKLKHIQTVGGGDCAEYALSGLKIALEFALPNSLAYVFSDATAKDLRHYGEVLELIQKKQTTVNFLLTGNCDDPTGPGYQVYLKLSRLSNGQVYDMNKSNVKDVLLAIRHSVNYNYAALKSVDTESVGPTNTKMAVDQSISELSVSLSGKNPRLTIKDPHNETVRSGDELSLENLKLVKIKDPIDGLWNVESAAESPHSIRLGAISEMNFDFGFSVDEAKKKSETSFQPLSDQKNVLSIFVSEPKLIKDLTDVTITLIPTTAHESSLQFRIPLKKVYENIYATKAFEVPRQMFKIQLNGVDFNGNSIERLISTGLHSSQGSAPEITIEASQMEIHEFDKLILKCIVKSHTAVNISWVFEGRTLKEIQSNQSNDLELTMNRITTAYEGKYVCEAINSYAGERRDVFIKVFSAPKVLIYPEKLNVVEGTEAIIECLIVETKDGKSQEITWIDDHGSVLKKDDSPNFNFTASRNYHNTTITCQIQNAGVLISNSSLIFVEYPPKFTNELLETNVKVAHGENFQLSCESDENPRGMIEWFFTSKHSIETQVIKNEERFITISRMDEKKQGRYDCVVQNTIGRVKRSFDVIDFPKSSPKILVDKDVLIVNETDPVELFCETINSLPITNFSWFNENSDKYQQHVMQDEINDVFKYTLKIDKVDETDNGSFECYLANDLGDSKVSIDLLVQTPPKIESITLISKGDQTDIDEEPNVHEDDSIVLNCVVDGFPTPVVEWYKGQNKLDNGDNETSLMFTKVQEKDEGSYQCVAINILGNSSRSFQLIVNVAPKIDKPEESFVSVKEGEKVVLNCGIRGKPEPIVSWQINGRQIGEKFEINKVNHSMTFEALMADTGVYSCSGVNEHGSVMVNYTLLVKGFPKILLPNDETQSVKVNNDLTLSCDATGYPQPVITWSFNDQPIHQGSVLILRHLQLENWGGYVCTATNEVGSTQKVFFVTVSEPPAITSIFNNVTLFTNQTHQVQCETNEARDLDIYWTFDEVKVKDGSILLLTSTMKSGAYTCVAENAEGKVESSLHFEAINKPSLVINYDELKKEIKVREGDGLELICPFENFESISWKFNNNSISNAHETYGNKLTIKKIDRVVDGEWRCFVSNLAGNDTFAMNVTVLASPTILASWDLNNRISDFLVTESDIDEITFKVGKTLELNCTAKGYPKPKVTWKKATDVVAEGETLFIENLQYHHSDIYTCSAENDQGIVKKFFKIEVVSAPYIDHTDIQKNFQKAIGDSITLHCRIIGNPIPNIFWFKDNILLDDETEDYLELKKLSLTDDGVYKCFGKNSFGKESIEFHVSVMNAAKVINAGEEPKTSRNNNSLKLSCTVKGNPLPIVSWISNGHILSTTSKLNLEKLFANVDGPVVHFNGHGNSISYLDPFQLKKSNDKFYSQLTKLNEHSVKLDIVFRDRSPKVSGNYNCYAYNALGRDEKKVDVKILEKPFANERQMEQLYSNEVLEGLPLLLTCLISGEPSPQITWYKENIQLHHNDTIRIINSGRFLSIAETFSWNSGNYSCKGVNEIGETILEFQVFILEPPKFIDFSVISPSNQNRFHNDKDKTIKRKDEKDELRVMRDEDVTLECFARGTPHPHIHWVKMNFYDSSQNEILDENENIFIIRSIKESANFMCYINNTVGNIHKMFFVAVQYAPSFIDNKFEHQINVKLHHGVNLDCQADGNPEPKIMWSFNGTEILPNNKNFYFSNANQIMRINEAKKSDQGKFLCEAGNEFGKIKKVFYVNVEVPIQWSPFGPWSACSVSCGPGGIQYRTRICLLSNGFPATANDYKCVGENSEARKCNRLPCPVNGSWGKFSKWSECPICVNEKDREKSFYSTRLRKCDSPAPANGGLDCQGIDKEEIECEVKICPINGGWSDWSSWSECSKPCGISHRMRKRLCNNPEPKHNGEVCEGENVEFDDCKKPLCVHRSMKKSFRADDEDDLEEMSNETRDRYGEAAEFEMKNQAGIPRNFQFTQHREVEFLPSTKASHEPKIPKIIITLDTFKPISEEAYKQHISRSKVNINEEVENMESSSSFENLEFESTESDQAPKTCVQGFFYNSLESQCRDINECLNRRLYNCASDETCFNTIGSYRCEKKQKKTRN